MPAPAIVAGLSAADLIALGGTVASTATAIGTLPDELVTIGSISISLASRGTFYVGDTFVITGEFDVSYGEVSGNEGRIVIEIIEEGKGVIKTFPQIQAQSPKEHISFRMNGRFISHGTKYYYIKVTATGEEDLSWLPNGDTVITKSGVSGTIGLEVKKPISFTTNLLTPSVNHGDYSRTLMYATNHSESDARIVVQIEWQRSFPREAHALTTSLRAGQTDLQILDYRKKHNGDNHSDEKIFYIEPIKHIYHNHQIKAPWGDYFYRYDQLYPDKEKVFPPLTVNCKGTKKETEVSFVPNPTLGLLQKKEQNYKCATLDENEESLLCGALLFDQYGNTLVGVPQDSSNEIHFRGKLCGQIATLKLTPSSSLYSSFTTTVYLQEPLLETDHDTYIFYPTSLPAIQGVVWIEELGRLVSGAKISFINSKLGVIYETVTAEDGKFSIPCHTKSFVNGQALIKVALPRNISFQWMEDELFREISLEEISADGHVCLIHASVEKSEDWAKISGQVTFKDYQSGLNHAVKDATVVVRNEQDEVEDKSTTDEFGNYSFGVKPGWYFVEVENAIELGFESRNRNFIEIRNSRTQINVKLSLPKPEIERKTTNYLKGKASPFKSDKIVVFEKNQLLKEIEVNKKNFYLDLDELTANNDVTISWKRGELLGKPISLKDLLKNI